MSRQSDCGSRKAVAQAAVLAVASLVVGCFGEAEGFVSCTRASECTEGQVCLDGYCQVLPAVSVPADGGVESDLKDGSIAKPDASASVSVVLGDGGLLTTDDASLPDPPTPDASVEAPRLRLTLDSRSVRMPRIGTASLGFRLRRFGALADADVVVSVTGLPAGVEIEDVTVAGTETRGQLTVVAASPASAGESRARVVAQSGEHDGYRMMDLELVGLSGDTDESFGSEGRTVLDRIDASSVAAVAALPDGRIVAAGQVDEDFALLRFLADGELDDTFGTDGITQTDLGGEHDRPTALAVLPDGQLLVAGRGGADDNLCVVRYSADGIVDMEFAAGGQACVDGTTGAAGLILQDDGKILLVGAKSGAMAVARLWPSGSLDTGFGWDGIATVSFGGGSSGAYHAVVQPDDDIVVVGRTHVSLTGWDVGIARLDADGSLDTDFGNEGLVVTDIAAGDDLGGTIVHTRDGRLVVCAITSSAAGDDDIVMLRYSGEGAVDSRFGGDGVVSTGLQSAPDRAPAMVLQPDGTVVLAGTTSDETGGAALVRYRLTGYADRSFGEDGTVLLELGLSPLSDLAIARQPDGQLLIGGLAQTRSTDVRFLLARIWP